MRNKVDQRRVSVQEVSSIQILQMSNVSFHTNRRISPCLIFHAFLSLIINDVKEGCIIQFLLHNSGTGSL